MIVGLVQKIALEEMDTRPMPNKATLKSQLEDHRKKVSITRRHEKSFAGTAKRSTSCFYYRGALCICISGPFPDCESGTAGTAPRPGQSRDGSGPARSPFRGLGRRADASGRAWREL